MKAKLRIKIMQETTRIKNLKNVLNECDNKQSYKMIKEKKRLNDKIEFYKMINRIIEECNNDKF